MSKARDLANAADVLDDVSATEIGYLDGVTSAIQTQLDAKTAKSTLTTTGDIYYASAANTPARLGIGTASQLLAVNSGATAPEWVAAPSSGGMTLISTTTLTSGSVDLTSIPATYYNLQLVIRNYKPGTDGEYIWMRFNSDSNTRYSARTSISTGLSFGTTQIQLSDGNDDSVATGLIVCDIFDYANTATWKMLNTTSMETNATTTTQFNFRSSSGMYNQTGAISSITLGQTGLSFTSGTALLYGVK
jgi:hypothetical protein